MEAKRVHGALGKPLNLACLHPNLLAAISTFCTPLEHVLVLPRVCNAFHAVCQAPSAWPRTLSRSDFTARDHILRVLAVARPTVVDLGDQNLGTSSWKSILALTGLRRLKLTVQQQVATNELSALTALERLHISCSHEQTDSLQTALESLPSLTDFSLLALGDGVALCDATNLLRALLRSQPGLRRLSLVYCQLRGACVDLLAQMTALERLRVRYCDLDPVPLASALCALPRLRSLDVSSSPMDPEHLRDVPFAKNLRALDFEGSDAGALAVAMPSSARSLTRLNLSTGMNLDDQHVASFLARQPLLSLNLCGCRVTESALILVLTTCTALTHLDLTLQRRVNDRVLVHLPRLASLTSLELAMSLTVTAASLPRLAELPRLRRVVLPSLDNIRKGQWAPLAALAPTLRDLDLDCSLMEEEGLAALARLTGLRALVLTDSPHVEDEQLLACLQPMPLDRFVLRGPAKARRLPRTFAMLRARGVIVQELGRQ